MLLQDLRRKGWGGLDDERLQVSNGESQSDA